MKTHFEERFEEDLPKIKNSLSKKSGVKAVAKVNERIGCLKQKYPSVHKRYNIDLQTDEQGKKIVQISLDKNPAAEQHQQQSLGRYFLRSNRSMPNEAFAWEAYNTIREIESTFLTLKTDLDLRSIYQQNNKSTLAHLHLGILAYTLVNTIRCKHKANNIRHS